MSGVQLLQRIRQGASSVTVSATRDGGPIVAWETELASLSDSIVVSQGNSVVIVDAQAQVFNPEVEGAPVVTNLLRLGEVTHTPSMLVGILCSKV